jgi:hypothetical protein
VYFNGATEMFNYPLDLKYAPEHLQCSETEILLHNSHEVCVVNMQPLITLLKPMQAMFTDVPKLILWMEFVDKRID